MGYTSKAATGFFGQTFLKVLGSAIVLLKVAILARILDPTAFGIFSLVTIALGLTEAFTQTGVNTTIIQSKKPVSFFVNTAWVIAIVRGFLIGLLMLVVGWGMSLYFQQSELMYLVAVAALVPVIKGFINPAIIGLYKDLRFISDTMYRLILVICEAVAIIGLVWVFRSVYAWVAGLVVAAALEVLLSFIFIKLKPKFEYLKNPAKIIFAQTKVLSINSLLSYLIENTDNLLIGKVVGEFGLGLYQPTYGLTHEATYEIAKSAHHGTLPVFTRIEAEAARLKRAFLRTLGTTMGLVTLGSLPLLIFPALIIQIVLGDQWQGAVEIVRWLTLAGWIQALSMVCYTLLLARRKVHSMNWHMGLNLVLLVGLVYWGGVQAGLLGAVLGLLASRVLALPVLAMAVVKELRSDV